MDHSHSMTPSPMGEPAPWRAMAWRAAACAAAAAAGWACQRSNAPLSTVFFAIAYLAGAWDLAVRTWHELIRRQFNTNFLMLLVVPATLALGALGEGALLLILFSTSSALEEFANNRTREAIGALMRGAPKTALVLDGDAVSERPVESVETGWRVRIPPGQQVPVDLRIERGESACDESSLTGESTPVDKRPGSLALAGTLNLWGVIEGVTLRPAQLSTWQRMIDLVERARALRSPSQRFADLFGSRYTAFVLVSCTALFAWSWLHDGWPAFFADGGHTSAFYRAMTLLVVMSPCALVLSVPSAILSAIARGARQGVLFRGGAAIETLAVVDVFAMDKTGTLTRGDLRVDRIDVVSGREESLLTAGAALAGMSTHPVSRAVAAEALRRGHPLAPVGDVENLNGKGMRGTIDGVPIEIGSRAFVAADDPAATRVPPPPEQSAEMWVRTGTDFGRLVLTDSLRDEAPELLDELHREGARTIMLTGDRAAAAAHMAAVSGVNEVRAELSPDEKVAAIQSLKSGGHVVAMVGDGVNDAASLAAADVAVAMGARGSDAAIEQADVVLMHDRLENLLFARGLSRFARRIIRQNVAVAVGTMSIMSLVTLIATDIPLALSVATHEGSTAIVVLNSLRLLVGPIRSVRFRFPTTDHHESKKHSRSRRLLGELPQSP